jgi:hypothetical protein
MIDQILSAEDFGSAMAQIVRCVADEIAFKNAPASPAGERHSPFMTIEFHLLVRCAQITLGDNSTPILSVNYGRSGSWDDYAERRTCGMSAIRKMRRSSARRLRTS